MNYEEILNNLLQKGLKDGFILYKDIVKHYDEFSKEYQMIEDELSKYSISIVLEDEIISFDTDLINNDSKLDDLENEIDLNIELEEIDVTKELEEFDKIESLHTSLNINDPVRMYLKEIGKIPLLSLDEETKYATYLFQGRNARLKMDKEFTTMTDSEYEELSKLVDQEDYAREKLVNGNLRLVVSIAKHYLGKGLPFQDLIQEGNMGLIKACEKFDYEKGFKFSTYATWWIRQAISRASADQARTIRLPVHMVETINKLNQATKQLTQELGREPTLPEIAEKMGFTVEKVIYLKQINQQPSTLDQPIGDDETTTTGDYVKDPNGIDPYEYTFKKKLKEEINSVLDDLPDRERRVIQLRFGLVDGKEYTLEDVGKIFGVTRERIRQIECKALRKLKHPNRCKKLKDFLV